MTPRVSRHEYLYHLGFRACNIRVLRDANECIRVVAGKNPTIKLVPYIYRGSVLTGGFSRKKRPPTSPSHYANREDFFDFHPRRRCREGSRPAGARATSRRRRHAPACQRHHCLGEEVGDMVADHRSKTMVKLCRLELAETRFPKPGWGRVLETVLNSVENGMRRRDDGPSLGRHGDVATGLGEGRTL